MIKLVKHSCHSHSSKSYNWHVFACVCVPVFGCLCEPVLNKSGSLISWCGAISYTQAHVHCAYYLKFIKSGYFDFYRSWSSKPPLLENQLQMQLSQCFDTQVSLHWSWSMGIHISTVASLGLYHSAQHSLWQILCVHCMSWLLKVANCRVV